MAVITLQASEQGKGFSFVNWLKDTNIVKATNIQEIEPPQSGQIMYPAKTEFSDDFYDYFVDYTDNNIQVVQDYINQNLAWE